MAFTKRSGTFPGRATGKSRMTALALRIGRYEAEQALSRPLQSTYGFGRAAAKRLARDADINTRTAEDLINGEHLPSGLTFLRLLATVPEFAAEVRRITGLHADLDPRLERDTQQLLQTFQRWQAQREALDQNDEAHAAVPRRDGNVASQSSGEVAPAPVSAVKPKL